jgi:hypothetical protein
MQRRSRRLFFSPKKVNGACDQSWVERVTCSSAEADDVDHRHLCLAGGISSCEKNVDETRDSQLTSKSGKA